MMQNYGKFAKYFNSFNINDDKCQTCINAIEDSNHIIHNCNKYSEVRNTLIEGIVSNGGQWPVTEKELISKNFFNIFDKFCETIFSNDT
jgi:hypothetical protein